MDIGEEIRYVSWEYEVEDSKHDLFMDIGEEIRYVSCEPGSMR